ncbi:putative defense protein 3 [Dysidea avara]|uniref:putative defense protein 3 n=1 Tax=Dysidea avara TaxID=196820 RepID=UPI0033278B02
MQLQDTAGMKSTLCYTILINISLLVAVVNAMPNGAPSSACADIRPMHGSNTGTIGPPEYGPFLNNFPGLMYIPEQTYTISIEPTTGNRFRGFMIQGQTQPGGSPVGTFAASGTNYQAVCDNNTAATHTNRADKTSVSLTWTAPPAGAGLIGFRYAVVERYATFWDRQVSQLIREGNATLMSTSMITTTSAMSATTASSMSTTAAMDTTSSAMVASSSPSPTNNIGGGGGGGTTGLVASSVMILFLTMLLIAVS